MTRVGWVPSPQAAATPDTAAAIGVSGVSGDDRLRALPGSLIRSGCRRGTIRL
jgi:hypothetical protein